MIADILHTGFSVRDLDISVGWYTGVLGLELVHRQRGDNAYTRTLVGVAGAVIEVAQLAIPGSPSRYSTHMLELIQYTRGGGPDHRDLAVNRVGTAHLAFIVTDLDARYERMLAAGAHFVNPPVTVTEGVNAGGSACYLNDPDGITIELMQFGPDRARALGISEGPQ